MSNHLEDLNIQIKQEADEILYSKGLIDILSAFGSPHIHGSYSLDLMTWRDLDIYLEIKKISETQLFNLAEMIFRTFQPVKMSFRNELKARTPGLPEGLYWGIYLGNERAGAWKIDIWLVSGAECKRLLQYNHNIKRNLNPESVQRILEIKSACWTDPEYRRSFSSADIYEAVLEKNISGIERFKQYLDGEK